MFQTTHTRIGKHLRRVGLLAAAGLLLSACSQDSSGPQSASEAHIHEHADRPVAVTPLGKLAGQHDSEKNVLVFKGIHYGQSTAGENRFRAPKPVTAWDGVKDASNFGPACPQGGQAGRKIKGSDQLLPISEDCLVLNVWTPALDDGKRPVMVWLHGRGFYAGAGSEELYDGANLARRGDVVVVTINHRLNVFGYLHLADLDGENFATSGNAGVQDMELALRWVKDNIQAFGGDSSNVTIFGESGGGVKVGTLLGVPSAKGLFQRGIIQSGARLTGMPLEAARRSTETLMKKLDVTSIEELQAIPMEDMIAAITAADGRTTPNFGPITDGNYLPQDMFSPESAPSAQGVPVIVGSNRDEYSIYERSNPNFGKMTAEELERVLRPSLGKKYEEVIAAYSESRGTDNPWDLYVAIRSNRFHIGSIRLAEVHSKAAPVYFYSFDFPVTERLKAAHGAEIAFVFNNASENPNARPGTADVESAMTEAWIAFARTGNPNHAGMPHWPTYDAETRAAMVFDAETKVVNDPRPLERLVWEE